jgi:hypothetical protein
LWATKDEILGGLSANLPLPDYGRVARNPFRTARIALHCATVQV